MDILQYIQRMNQLYGSEQQVAKADNIYPWGSEKNPSWMYVPKDPKGQQDFLEDFDVDKATMHAEGGRIGFKHGGSWADWMSNHSDQMTFEEYLQMDMDKPVHPINKSAGGRVYDTRKYFSRGQLVQPGPGRPGYAGLDADKLIKAYGEEGANSPIRREIKKSLLKNKQFKDFIGEKELKRVSKLDPSGAKGWTESNLIKKFITYRSHMNMLPDKGKGYISAMKLADKLGIPENTFWNNIGSIKKDYPQYNFKKLNETLKGETLTIDGNNFHYYKDPGKKEMKVLLEYFDRPILGKDTVKGLNAFFKDEAIMKLLDDRLFPDIEDAQRVLKAAKLPASEHNAATAMLRLGEVLQGKQFKNQIDIKGNKVLGNYIVKQLDNFDMTHPWSRGVYDAAVREISENMPRQVGSIEKYKTLLKGALPDGFLEKKNLNMNEIFSVKASARNKAYPYAYFIDVIDKDLNQNELAKFHGHLSQAQTNLRNKISQIRKTQNPKFRKALYKEAEDIVKKFEGTRKTWKNTIKKNYPGKKFNLPNIVLGKEKEILAKDMKIAENIYKKAELDKWAAQNIDIAGHARKTGYVLTGADKGMLVTDIKKDPIKFLKQAGFNFDHCKLKSVGGSYNTCVRDTIEAEQKKAIDGDAKSKAKFSKVGKLASKAGWVVGWIDAPIELAFALPHMLRGDVNAAKRATILGFAGWGSDKELGIARRKSPMAYRSFKRKRDIDNYIDNWFRSETDKQTLETAPEEFKSDLKQNITTSLTNMENIAKNFPASDPETMYREDKRGREYIREEAEKRARAGLTITDVPFAGDVKFAPGAEGEKLDTLEKYIKYKGEPYWKNIEPMLEDLNYPFALHPYQVKDERDRYSELPIKLASELGPLEAKETRTALEELESRNIPFYNQGGRVPFGKGKVVKGIDEGRRAFMKWLAGITGAGVAVGTGLLKFGKTIGKGKTVVKAGDHIIQGTKGMPEWYIPLVNRIVNEGTDVTKKLGTVEREIVHTKKIGKGEEATVYQNLDTGNVRVEYQSAHSEVPIQMDYKAPVEDITSKGKPIKTEPEFQAVESEPKWEVMGPDDADLGFDGENIVGRVEDLTTDTSKLKEFGKNKKLTIKEKIEAKKKQDYRKSLEHDSETQADYIETKYGPGPEPDVGMDEFGNLVDEYGEIID